MVLTSNPQMISLPGVLRSIIPSSERLVTCFPDCWSYQAYSMMPLNGVAPIPWWRKLIAVTVGTLEMR